MSGRGTIIRIALEFLRQVRQHSGASASGSGGTNRPWSTDQRRTALQAFAKHELAKPNKAQAFLNILARAVELSEGASGRSAAVVGDIKAVLIGDGFGEGRGKGPYFVGEGGGIADFLGSNGFKPHLRDDHFQVQHAAAGLVIGYEHGDRAYGPILEQALVEGELQSWPPPAQPQDAALYKATFPIGQWLRNLDQETFIRPDAIIIAPGANPDERLAALPALMLQGIGDSSCTVPPSVSTQPFDMEADARAHEFDSVAAAAADSGQFDMEADAKHGQLRAFFGVGADVVNRTLEASEPLFGILGVSRPRPAEQ